MGVEVARRWWPLVAALLLGVAVGVLLSLLGSGTRRAEASVLISSPAGPPAVRPMLPNLRVLATSGVVAGNVQSTLRLRGSTEALRRRLRATLRPGSEVIALSASDANVDHARQLTQEAAVVFAQLVDARFGTGTPELHAAVLDSAHALGGPQRHVLRNGLLGGLVGLLLGSSALFVLVTSGKTLPVGEDHGELREREDLIAERVKAVTARELSVAEQVGKLAARERELQARAAELADAERALSDRAAKVAAGEEELGVREGRLAAHEQILEASLAAPTPSPPEPEPEVQPVPLAKPGRALSPRGSWNLNDLERALDGRPDAPPEEAETWRTYLYFLREHAAVDGTLPRLFDALIVEVLGPLLSSRR
jgi:hypothetical protein